MHILLQPNVESFDPFFIGYYILRFRLNGHQALYCTIFSRLRHVTASVSTAMSSAWNYIHYVCISSYEPHIAFQWSLPKIEKRTAGESESLVYALIHTLELRPMQESCKHWFVLVDLKTARPFWLSSTMEFRCHSCRCSHLRAVFLSPSIYVYFLTFHNRDVSAKRRKNPQFLWKWHRNGKHTRDKQPRTIGAKILAIF